MQFHHAKVVALKYPTEDALSLTLEPQVSNSSLFNYQAGQHLYIKVQINGQELIRAYSLNSSPVLEDALQITIKRIKDGKVSSYLHQTVQVGTSLQVSEPKGTFTADIQVSNHRSYYFFTTGSGITPIWSMIQTILTVEPWSYVYLLYGSRDEENIIFHDEILQWQQDHINRFVYEPILSQPLSHRWSALLSTRKVWEGEVGRIDAKHVTDFIHRHPPAAQRVKYLLCGVGDMMQTVRETLLKLDVEPSDISSEYFSSPTLHHDTKIDAIGSAMTVKLDKQTFQIKVQPQQTLLEAMLAEAIEAPYACQSGVCGECRCRLTKGKVSMQSHMALSDEELANNMILPCQSYAQSQALSLSY